MMHRLSVLTGLCLLLFSSFLYANTLGDIQVHSAVGEPFYATIEVDMSNAEDADLMLANIATQAIHSAFGVQFSEYASTIRVQATQRDTKMVLSLNSNKTLREPFFEFIFELRLLSGSIYRAYSVVPEFNIPAFLIADNDLETAPKSTPASKSRTEIASGPYTVQSGDSVWRIAEWMSASLGSLSQRVEYLIASNPQLIDGEIHPGDLLSIPSEAPEQKIQTPAPASVAQTSSSENQPVSVQPKPNALADSESGKQATSPALPEQRSNHDKPTDAELNGLAKRAAGYRIVRLMARSGPEFRQASTGAATLIGETVDDLSLDLAEIKTNLESLAQENSSLAADVRRLELENQATRDELSSRAGSSLPSSESDIVKTPVGQAVSASSEEVGATQASNQPFFGWLQTWLLIVILVCLLAVAVAVGLLWRRQNDDRPAYSPDAPPLTESESIEPPTPDQSSEAIQPNTAEQTPIEESPVDETPYALRSGEKPAPIQFGSKKGSGAAVEETLQKAPNNAAPFNDSPDQPVEFDQIDFTNASENPEVEESVVNEASYEETFSEELTNAFTDKVDSDFGGETVDAIAEGDGDELIASLVDELSEVFGSEPLEEIDESATDMTDLEFDIDSETPATPNETDESDDASKQALESKLLGEVFEDVQLPLVEQDTIDFVADADDEVLTTTAIDLAVSGARYSDLQREWEASIEAGTAAGESLAVAYLDLDNMSSVEDQQGPMRVEGLVIQAHHLLSAATGTFGQSLHRIKDHTFLFVFTYKTEAELRERGKALVRLVQDHDFVVRNEHFSLTISIGLVPYTKQFSTLDDYIRSGKTTVDELRVELAKSRLSGGVAIHHQGGSLAADWENEADFAEKVAQLLDENGFDVQYQTLINLSGNHQQVYMCKTDLSPRVDTETLPANFLKMAFTCSATPQIERQSILAFMEKIRSLGGDSVKMLFRIDIRSAMDPEFEAWLFQQVEDKGIDPTSITLFVSAEDVIAHKPHIIGFAAALKRRGSSLGILNVDYDEDHLQAALDVGASIVRVQPTIVDDFVESFIRFGSRPANTGTRESSRFKSYLESYQSKGIETVLFSNYVEAIPGLVVFNASNLRASYIQTPIGMIEEDPNF